MTSRWSTAVMVTGAAAAVEGRPRPMAQASASRRICNVFIGVLRGPDSCRWSVRPGPTVEVPEPDWRRPGAGPGRLLQVEDHVHAGREVGALGLDAPRADLREPPCELGIARLRDERLHHRER